MKRKQELWCELRRILFVSMVSLYRARLVGIYGVMEHAPHRLRHLNSCFLVDRAVWGALGGVALMEGVCHWR